MLEYYKAAKTPRDDRFNYGYCRKHLNRPLYFRRKKWPDVVDGCVECQRIKRGE